LVGNQIINDFELEVNNVTSSYIKNGEEIYLNLYDSKNPFFTWDETSKLLS
jgi:hypothetical protein